MTEISQLRLALEPRFIFFDSASVQFRSVSSEGTIGTGLCALADSWTTGCLFSPILHFPSATTPCIKYIAMQYSYLCKTDISELKVGDLVRVQVFLYRRDGYEHQTPVKISSNGTRCWTMRAETTVVLSLLETQEISGCCMA
ncbi:hypothetical protein B0H17DRAFT_1147409 [Mycena rosella]|uniref:Uncharacterized protein n=1 Tax=Mycena rosella TaxID=1033263 RepID=A0AAD7G3T4_MYCRO|nr:hypothetical protein B0H17DRAFT_1147409 [Mycena rosella]